MPTLNGKTWDIAWRSADNKLYMSDYWPYALTITQTASGVQLSWPAVTHPDFYQFRVMRSANGGQSYGSSGLTNNGVTTNTTFTDTTGVDGTTYHYLVVWHDSQGVIRENPSTRDSFVPQGVQYGIVAGPFNVNPITSGSIFDNDTGITNANATWIVTAEDALDGTFTYNQSGFSYASVSTGAASFDYQILNFDGQGANTSATVTVNVEPYDLTAGGTRTVPFSYSWPTEPTITAETSVSNSSELATAIALGGRRITLNPGTYSGITLNTNDTHLIISTGVTVSAAGGAALTIGGNRVRITGDRGATMLGRWQITGDDVFIEDQNMANSDSENVIIQSGAARVAILSSTMSSERFALQTYGGVSDIIVANSSITVSSQTPARLAKVDRLLLVDNLFDASAAGPANVFRSGENYVNNLWFLGNQVEDAGTFGFEFSVVDPDNTAARVTSSGLYFYDSALYSSGNTQMNFYTQNSGDQDYIENVTFDNFTIYSGGKSPGSNIFPISGFGTAGQANWTETNSGYQASTTAPAWTMK